MAICKTCGNTLNRGASFCSSKCYGAAQIKPVSERFWPKVDKTPECWNWTGASGPNGYGYFREGLAHRVSWELANGPIPSGLQVLHHCDNRKCVNPEHLWLGTQQENIDDMMEKGRWKSGKRNPPIGESVHNAKLSASAVNAIRLGRMAGLTIDQLANKFSVSAATISLVANRKRWKHIS